MSQALQGSKHQGRGAGKTRRGAQHACWAQRPLNNRQVHRLVCMPPHGGLTADVAPQWSSHTRGSHPRWAAARIGTAATASQPSQPAGGLRSGRLCRGRLGAAGRRCSSRGTAALPPGAGAGAGLAGAGGAPAAAAERGGCAAGSGQAAAAAGLGAAAPVKVDGALVGDGRQVQRGVLCHEEESGGRTGVGDRMSCRLWSCS